MAKLIRKVYNPKRDRMLSLLAGLIGGIVAGVGTSFLVNMQWNKHMTSHDNGGSSHPTSRSSSGQRNSVQSGSRTSRASGSNLAAGEIPPSDMQAKGEPGTDSSLNA